MQEVMKDSQKGVALLIVLWVITILMVTVLSFALMIRAETYGALIYRDRLEKQFLAEAGIERGIAEVVYRLVNRRQTVILEGREIWKVDGTSYAGRMGKGAYKVRIFDETGKISLNGLTEASSIVLKNLLVNMKVSPERADVITDSILDWKDEDNLHRLSGAEDDYYLSLPHPYKARNSNFENLEELLLVKGMTPDIFYGTDAKKGLIHFLSLHNNTGLINLNAAPREVLTALPGMDSAQADQLIQLRETAKDVPQEDIMRILGGTYALMQSYVSVQTGTAVIYTIEALGYKDNEKGAYPIRATVGMEGLNRYRYLYYSSPAGELM
jgi:general secretion pathway protein K